jgi:DNA-binding NarL/FixJ family response regulator
MTAIRVMLADDHLVVREGLRLLVDGQPDMEVVAEAADGQEAVRLAKTLLPDVLVMDVSMPVMNGLKASTTLGATCPDVKILTLSRHSDEAFVRQLVGAGVRGYVLKQSAHSELIGAIRTVASGGSYVDPALAGRVLSGFARRGEPKELGKREAEVLRLVARGYSNKEIGARLDISV